MFDYTRGIHFLVVGVCLTTPVLAGTPSVPGFSVETYAVFPTDVAPLHLSFAPSGLLFVSNDNNSGAGVTIYRVGMGGTPVEPYGPPIWDPDPVAFDAFGSVTGVPGSVFTGNAGKVIEIDPNQQNSDCAVDNRLQNPNDMVFDPQGRLLIADTAGGVFRLTACGTVPTLLFTAEYPGTLDVDTHGWIFTSARGNGGRILIHDANGNSLNDACVTGLSTDEADGIAFGTGTCPWGTDLYVVNRTTRELLRVAVGPDAGCTQTVIGTELDEGWGLAFGPDNALYVSGGWSNVVWRIVPLDSDDDGVADLCDDCPNDPNKSAPGDCGCGISDAIGFVGFLPPIGGADATGGSFANPLRAFKLGSTIPVKFMASQCGNPLLTGIHTLRAVKYSSAVDSDPPIDATPTDAATSGNEFRLTDGGWHFNLSTRTGFSQGTWKLIATLSDDSTHYVWITIKK